jgi:hypothetical protein
MGEKSDSYSFLSSCSRLSRGCPVWFIDLPICAPTVVKYSIGILARSDSGQGARRANDAGNKE